MNIDTDLPDNFEARKDIDYDSVELNGLAMEESIKQFIQQSNSEKENALQKEAIMDEIIEEAVSSSSSDSDIKSIKTQEDKSPVQQEIPVPDMNLAKRRSSASRAFGGLLESFTVNKQLRSDSKRRRSSLDTNLLMNIKALKSQHTKDAEQIEVIDSS
jgi:hypothetical protein